ncbi:chemotaxis protein CheW [Abyssibacter profundi]|uniref:Chemotaxis protein CheW n=2 Tax=Abyssibacter profundi TaxID=2182787 RepID=A0A383XQW0_9GAMM|nr:chemotaxis protein CheW [Abyssibacter profundi]
MDEDARAQPHLSEQESNEPTQEFLTFRLGDEEYGVDILKVQEIRGYDTVTKIPDAPEYVKGVINLRGTIMPVVDLRLRFRLGEPRYDEFTVMIILHLESRKVGIVVDSVSDVLNLRESQMLPPPEFGGHLNANSIRGLGSAGERLVILIDIERFMASEDMALSTAAPAAAVSN